VLTVTDCQDAQLYCKQFDFDAQTLRSWIPVQSHLTLNNIEKLTACLSQTIDRTILEGLRSNLPVSSLKTKTSGQKWVSKTSGQKWVYPSPADFYRSGNFASLVAQDSKFTDTDLNSSKKVVLQ